MASILWWMDVVIANLRLTALQAAHRLAALLSLCVLHYGADDRRFVFSLRNRIRRERVLLLNYVEIHQLIMALQQTERFGGDVAEVGVFQGGSAKILAMYKGIRPLHLFDTFQGLPEVDPRVDGRFYTGQFAASEDSVRAYLAEFPSVSIYRGVFPHETGHAVADRRFSFVHLDVDVKSSMEACLNFFWPRMQSGGIILCHDYSAEGVRIAVDRFFSDRHVPVIALPTHQCLIVKGV
jgi:O-methyltransferase